MARKKAAKKATSGAGKKASGKKTLAKSSTGKALSLAAAGLLPDGYGELLEDLKTRVRAAQLKAAVAVNRELIQLYWDIGQLIVERQEREGWGTSVIDRLAGDLQKAFPGLKGFSPSNISRMRAFFVAYNRETENSAQAVPKLKGKKSAQAVPKLAVSKVAQPERQMPGSLPPAPLAEIPWGHNVVLLFKLSDLGERLWYAAND